MAANETTETANPVANERKTLEQRATMSDIERLRHSAAHVLASAMPCHPERSGAKSKDPAVP